MPVIIPAVWQPLRPSMGSTHGEAICNCANLLQFQGSNHNAISPMTSCGAEMSTTSPSHHLNEVELSLPVRGPGGGQRRGIQPNVARKLAASVVFMSAVLMSSVRGLLAGMSQEIDFMEVACAPESSLFAAIADMGYHIQRVSYKEGYDLSRKYSTYQLHQRIARNSPKHRWISLPCTRFSNLTYLTPHASDG